MHKYLVTCSTAVNAILAWTRALGFSLSCKSMFVVLSWALFEKRERLKYTPVLLPFTSSNDTLLSLRDSRVPWRNAKTTEMFRTLACSSHSNAFIFNIVRINLGGTRVFCNFSWNLMKWILCRIFSASMFVNCTCVCKLGGLVGQDTYAHFNLMTSIDPKSESPEHP